MFEPRSIACWVSHIDSSLFGEAPGTISLYPLIMRVTLGGTMLPDSFMISLFMILSSVWLEAYLICIKLSSLANMVATAATS